MVNIASVLRNITVKCIKKLICIKLCYLRSSNQNCMCQKFDSDHEAEFLQDAMNVFTFLNLEEALEDIITV